ncbi:hypothetical protein SAMN05421730_10031, partial [Anaerobium acetethylicum]
DELIVKEKLLQGNMEQQKIERAITQHA